MSPPPLLVVGIGNPSRGDDALGPCFLERLETELHDELASGQLELLGDFQLQIEHALDLSGRQRVLFVDASVSAPPPFDYRRVHPERDATHSSHAMSPAAVLETHQRILGEPPEAWTLAIRGERFELGEGLSASARAGLDAAVAFFLESLRPALSALPAPEADAVSGARFTVSGVVQGVGFRPWVARKACSLGLAGRVFNAASGAVIEAFGTAASLGALEQALRTGGPPAARVESVQRAPLESAEPPSPSPFRIDASALGTGPLDALHETASAPQPRPGHSLPLPADLATCDACLDEVRRPDDRHFDYAFTSCTDCGPRYAIATQLPYDRERTTMAGFAPCPACAAEYADPDERRFHAQTLACPTCGPRLWLTTPDGAETPCAAPLDEAARLLTTGKLLALRGLGAFHLACDATDATAVERLRQRKRRDAKPFAVMVASLDEAERYAVLDDVARTALTSPPRPIVLVPARPHAGARPGAVAPSVLGPSSRIGLMLPYTPLHALLLARVKRPLVMTSGNLSGEPVCIDNDEAVRQLGPLVDALLLHDRPIARRVEDSVVSVSTTGARPWRRARGFAPRPIRLPLPSPEPVLAVGGQLKSTVCLVVDDRAYLSSHLGDLDSVQGEAAFRREVESLESLLNVRPDVVAHDLHPDYASTHYALSRTARVHHGVQHHVAHVLAAIAELGRDEPDLLSAPVLGVAFDGTGFGTDGTAWGGELLLLHGRRWQRLASLRPLPLPGGEAALREVWRQAFALLCDAFEPSEALTLATRLPCFEGIPASTLRTLQQMMATGVQSPRARGVGRYFDAVGALTLGLSHARFEGHIAMALEEAAADAHAHVDVDVDGDGDVNAQIHPYRSWLPPPSLDLSEPLSPASPLAPSSEIDLRPMTRALVQALLDGTSPGLVAARFHATLVAATAERVEQARALTGANHVILTGGAFQNRRLEAGLRQGRANVLLAQEVPVNDGGLALGQAWSAVLALRAERGEGLLHEGTSGEDRMPRPPASKPTPAQKTGDA